MINACFFEQYDLMHSHTYLQVIQEKRFVRGVGDILHGLTSGWSVRSFGSTVADMPNLSKSVAASDIFLDISLLHTVRSLGQECGFIRTGLARKIHPGGCAQK